MENDMADDFGLPTSVEIAELPRWARVALAARCARRVEPLYAGRWPEAPANHRAAVLRAVEVAEGSAARASSIGSIEAAANAAVAAASAAIFEAGKAGSNFLAARAADAAALAANAAPGMTADAVSNAASAAGLASDSNAAIRRDYELIRRLAAAEHWNDDTPVPPGVFGPLWPDGPPAGWPVNPSAQQAVKDSGVGTEVQP
jgi:hypothetical protein